jgi:hypothetical protein
MKILKRIRFHAEMLARYDFDLRRGVRVSITIGINLEEIHNILSPSIRGIHIHTTIHMYASTRTKD